MVKSNNNAIFQSLRDVRSNVISIRTTRYSVLSYQNQEDKYIKIWTKDDETRSIEEDFSEDLVSYEIKSLKEIKKIKDDKEQEIELSKRVNFLQTYSNKIKTQRNAESHLEDEAITIFELAGIRSELAYYLQQAMPVNGDNEFKGIPYKTEKGNTIIWIPDFALLWENGEIWIVECKTLQSYFKNKRKLDRKYSQSEKYCLKNGWKFVLFTDNFISKSWRVENTKDLQSQAKSYFLKKSCENFIIKIMTNEPGIIWNTKSIQTYILNVQAENLYLEKNKQKNIEQFTQSEILASVCSLILKGELFISDEESFDLTTSEVTLNKQDYLTCKDWILRYSGELELNQNENQDSDELVDLDQLTKSQKIVYLRNKEIISQWENNYNEKVAKGLIRYCSEKYSITRLTISRVTRKYLSSGRKNSSLIPKYRQKGKKAKKLFSINDPKRPSHKNLGYFEDNPFASTGPRFEKNTKKTIGIIENWRSIFDFVLNHKYLTLEKPSKKQTWEYYITKLNEAYYKLKISISDDLLYEELLLINPNLPSEFQFYRELRRYKFDFKEYTITKREGIREALKMNRNVVGTTPYMNLLGQTISIDHSPADIIIVPRSIYFENVEIEKGRKKSRRIFLPRLAVTLANELDSRAIISHELRMESSSKTTTFRVLRKAVIGKISRDNISLDKNKISRFSTAGKILFAFKQMLFLEVITQEDYNRIVKWFRKSPEGSVEPNLRTIADWYDNIKIMPRTVHSDLGSDFTAHAIEEWAQKYEIELMKRPVGGSNYGGHIERVIKTINSNVFHPMKGTTFTNLKERKDYPSEKYAVLFFEQCEALLLLGILKYNISHHSVIGMSPYEKYIQEVNNGHNLTPLRSVEDYKQFAFDTLDYAGRYDKKINRFRYPSYSPPNGITYKTLRYNYRKNKDYLEDKSWSEIYRKGDEVKVRWDRDDIRYCWWWNPSLKKNVQVWATNIKILGGRILSQTGLKKFSGGSISYGQYRDHKDNLDKIAGYDNIDEKNMLAKMRQQMNNLTVLMETSSKRQELLLKDADNPKQKERDRIRNQQKAESDVSVGDKQFRIIKGDEKPSSSLNPSTIKSRKKNQELAQKALLDADKPDNADDIVEIPVKKIPSNKSNNTKKASKLAYDELLNIDKRSRED